MIEPLILSRDGPLFLFAHANGYPPEAYRTFLLPFLDDFQVMALPLRPFWPGADPDRLKDWKLFRDDYLDFLQELESNQRLSGHSKIGINQVIGVGHSVGAMTTLMAAIERPDIFRALVLIEPVLFPPWRGTIMRAQAPFNLMRRFYPLIRGTLRRKANFPSREVMFTNYRSKQIFKGLSDPVLRDYVAGLVSDNPDGTVNLKYSPAWEARIYETSGLADAYVWRNLPKVSCPVLVLRGENSETLKPRVIRRMTKKLPDGQAYTQPEAGHLFPLELPDRAASLTVEYLKSI
ncbi:MAG: alpha/beta hydrolase [Anaerolineales bacterium]|nr:alpha/beta hydrolase [Anaerolineales bacterium]